MSDAFNPQRLTLARQKHGFTKAKLADLAGLTVRSITAYESGATVPTKETLDALAKVLEFPVSFFSLPEFDTPNVYGVSFRALKGITASRRDAALASGALAMEVSGWIETNFVLPDSDIPDYRGYSPEAAAAAMRRYWGLGEKPISNCIHLLESKGVRVFSLVEYCRELDAYSFWRGDVPFVFLNTIKSTEKSRFDSMHELGHLTLHRHHGITRSRETEQEADAFASCMLMPEFDVIGRAPRTPTLRQIIAAKKHWNVSAAALAYRMHSLKLLSDWQYRTLCIQLAQHGYRTNEPESSPRETSQILKKVFVMTREDGVSRSAVAAALHINVKDLESLVFGLVMTGIDGGGGASPDGETPSGNHLRLVT
jgi:Zn-dependent peptidase ImmA (M78 family)/transcriptional regulator with XRE-family HTH domain